MTDEKTLRYEHIAYFPFGETWVQESSATWRVPYQFTSKEMDSETGLYYFGARYYDPRTSVWQSADPILDQYLAGKRGRGGVFNSLNLSLYAYTHWNPVNLTAPDGRSIGIEGDDADVKKFFELTYKATGITVENKGEFFSKLLER